MVSGAVRPYEDNFESLQEDFAIEPQRTLLNVVNVEPNPVLKAYFIAAIDLPETGETGLNHQSLQLPSFIFLDFPG